MKIICNIFGRSVKATSVQEAAEYFTQPRYSDNNGAIETLQDEVGALRDFVVAMAAKSPELIAQYAREQGYTVEE